MTIPFLKIDYVLSQPFQSLKQDNFYVVLSFFWIKSQFNILYDKTVAKVGKIPNSATEKMKNMTNRILRYNV